MSNMDNIYKNIFLTFVIFKSRCVSVCGIKQHFGPVRNGEY